MNLTRRHLFRALSSVALAPLVKWLPKPEPEPQSFVGMISDVRVYSVDDFIAAEQAMRQKMFDEVEERFWSPVPQEEA